MSPFNFAFASVSPKHANSSSECNLNEVSDKALLNSTHKCNLSVRPFVMVAKLAKKYSRGVRKPSFFLVYCSICSE